MANVYVLWSGTAEDVVILLNILLQLSIFDKKKFVYFFCEIAVLCFSFSREKELRALAPEEYDITINVPKK